MKRITFFIFVVMVICQARGQTQAGSLGTATVTNAGNASISTPLFKGFFNTESVQFIDSTLSGTLALTATLQYSLDGAHWYSQKRDSVLTISTTGTYGWNLSGSNGTFSGEYIRVYFVGSGTQSTKVWGFYRLQKDQ